MPGAPAKMNKDDLDQLREQVFADGVLREGDSLGTDDETLLRFLRARKNDLKQAKKMLYDCHEWRGTVEGVGIDRLYKEIDPFDFPERQSVFECWPMWFHKTDKVRACLDAFIDNLYILSQKGRPINVHQLGNLDLPKLYKVCNPERHWQSVLVNCESLTREILPSASRSAGRHIGSVLVIVDLKGFGLSQFWQMKTLARRSFQVSQDYYPETMGQLAIVNAPQSFTAIWSAIKPWLSKETIEKVDILGSDYKEVLLDLADAENLPSSLGGNCTCDEAGGCQFSGAGPWLEGREGWGPRANVREKQNGVDKVAHSVSVAETEEHI